MKGKTARISMATNESYRKQSGERVNDTQWHNVVAWGPQAEFLEKYVQKGQGLVVNGKLSSRSYERWGEAYSTEIVANEFFLTAQGMIQSGQEYCFRKGSVKEPFI